MNMKMKEAYQKKLQAQLDELSADIHKLKAKADIAQADAQLVYYKEIEDLRSLQVATSSKLAKLKDASDDAWEELKAGIESMWDALKSANSKSK